MVDPYKTITVEVGDNQVQVPVIIHQLFSYIQTNMTEGIFRINGSMKKVNQYHRTLHNYSKWLHDEYTSVYDICSLLKKILGSYNFINVDLLLGFTGDVKADLVKFNQILNMCDHVSIAIFLYTIDNIHTLLQYHDITKMTVMNYAIIFQPIFIKSTDLIMLPSFINLIKLVLENKDSLLVLASTPLLEPTLTKDSAAFNRNSIFSESLFLYKFRNFTNKSIDSINDSFKTKPKSNDRIVNRKSQVWTQGFNGYKLRNASLNFTEDNIDPIQQVLPQDNLLNIEPTPQTPQIPQIPQTPQIPQIPQTPQNNTTPQCELIPTPESDVDSIHKLIQLTSANSQSLAFDVTIDSPTSRSSGSNDHVTIDNTNDSDRTDENETSFETLDSINEPQTESDSSPKPQKINRELVKLKLPLRDTTNFNRNNIKRRSFIGLFKGDGVKRNFSLKFKSKSV